MKHNACKEILYIYSDIIFPSKNRWCPSNHRCVSMDTYMISFPYGQCQSWMTAANTNYACQNNPFACKQQKTCSDCQSIGPRCGWCDDG